MPDDSRLNTPETTPRQIPTNSATAPSNEAFDRDLRARNPAWGLRDLETVAGLAASSGFAAPEIIDMPANNLSVIFRRR